MEQKYQNTEMIDNFETLLKKQASRKPHGLYAEVESQNKLLNKSQTRQISSSVKDVLEKVSMQIKAIQNADTASYKRVGNKLDKYKMKEFFSVDKIPVNKGVHQTKPSHFETQCFSDTQLINVVNNAEIVDEHRGVTQEFDTTFCQKIEGNSTNDKLANKTVIDDDLNENNDITSEMDTLPCNQIETIADLDYDRDQCNKNNKIDINEATQGLDDDIEVDDKDQERERPTSPILNAKTRSSTPPLVVSLYAFEKFENLVHPIIEKHTDLQTAKNLINSQIIDKELFLPNRICHNESQSPVLDKAEGFTFHTDDSLSIDANICEDEAIVNETVELQKNISPEDIDIYKNEDPANTQPKEFIKCEFKDEILFSSDEENEYLHKDVQELPLTCALETSFYDRSYVLDKTMYVGFQTASNKSIQISTDSFTVAKSILSDFDNGEASLKELVEIFDTGTEQNEKFSNMRLTGGQEVSIKNDCFSNIDTIKDIQHISKSSNKFEEEIEDTFKNIALTALEQDAESNDIAMSQVIEFKSISTSKFKAETNPEDVSQKANLVSRKRPLEGFKTASNKRIKLSKKALARCKKVFQDINLEDDYNDVNCKLEPNSKEDKINVKVEAANVIASQDIFEISDHHFETNVNGEKNDVLEGHINDQVILQEFEENDMPFEETNNKSLVKFITPCRKDINSSDSDFVKGKVKEDSDFIKIKMPTICPGHQDDPIFKKPEVVFRAVNKKVKDSNNYTETEILEKHTDNNDDDFDFGKACKFIGFKTASNKDIKISDHALERTENFYKSVYQEDKSDETEDNQKSIEEYHKFIDTEDFFAEELAFNEDFFKDDITNSKSPKKKIFKGFQTASNKAISISEKALAKSKRLFEDLTIIASDAVNDIEVQNVQQNHPQVENQIKALSTTNKENIKIISEGFIMNKENLNAQGNKQDAKEAPTFKGFQTASNRKVKILDEALVKSKKIQDMSQSNVQTENTVFSDFQTASNKKLEVSETALQRTKQLLQELDVNKEFDVGFKLVSSKAVNISEKALAKSKHLFNDIGFHDHIKRSTKDNFNLNPSKNQFAGFQTASKKEVTISADALAKSKQMLDDFEFNHISNINDQPLTNKFIGFHNKAVKFSDGHLAKTETVFGDIDQRERVNNEQIGNHTPVFKGFQTASNKKVHISEKALEKSNKLFQDITESQPKYDSNVEKCEDVNVFRGFQTASNKAVKISEKALAKSKKLFEDIGLSQFHQDDHKNTDVNELDIGDAKKEKHNKPKAEDNNIINDIEEKVFIGFQTASNKKVQISETALEKSKKHFQDINVSQQKGDSDATDANKYEDCTVFRGFQTASKKTVKISDIALARSKKLFEDIGLSQLDKENQNAENLNKYGQSTADVNLVNDMRESGFKGFQTASNKKVVISEQALAKTKVVFDEINQEITTDFVIKNDTSTPVIVKNVPGVINSRTNNNANIIATANVSDKTNTSNKDIIDTQVLNDFQDSLHTEDFSESTPKSKRSGSPILSCPRAKKRKFETPYRTKKIVEPIIFEPPKVAQSYKFKDDYKKNKKYNLKDLLALEEKQSDFEIYPHNSKFNFDNLLTFEFVDLRNDYNEHKMNVEQLKKIFLDSVNKKIVPEGWLDNHVQLILWKLLSYEIKFPNVMINVCTVRNVLEQLKYRYDRELYNVQRPILRKILEKDDVASKTMVLCVAAIYVDDISVTRITTASNNIELLVTDGWYCLKASTDRMLCKLVCNSRIVVGSKIATYGAELIGCEQGKSPWEDISTVRLKLSGNSTRRARWHAKLGPRAGVVACSLGAARADGGRAALRALARRVYPPLYVERMPDGGTVTLSERLEHVRQMKYETERQLIMEKLYEELEMEMADQQSQYSEGCSNDRNCLESGSQISKLMKNSRDPDEYRSLLTKSQNQMLEEHNVKRREKQIEEMRVKFQEKLEKNGLKSERNVVPLLKVRIVDFREKETGVEVSKGYLSIWKPSAAVVDIIEEGSWIEILNVIPTGVRNSEIQLSAGRQTIFNPYKQRSDKFQLYANTLKRACYEIKNLSHNPAMTTDYNEIDTVGMIFEIEPSTKEFDDKKQNFQNVYLADADKNIICVNFWGGLKKFGFENILDTGQIVTCVNLQKRAGNSRKSITEYRVTELSYFTKTPKDKRASDLTNELSNKLSKSKEKFCEDCIVLKNNYSIFKTRNNENVSPYRFDSYNVSRNYESPLRCDANINLTGLDFESSFKEPQISPMALFRKKQVNEKIQKLKMYGEPPRLSSIHIINKSKNAFATYKSPLIQNSNATGFENRSPSVASEKKEIGLQNITSPISMNMTYVKSVNPVKLNFSNSDANENNLNDSVDHFAEEFDASPPLSLDSDDV